MKRLAFLGLIALALAFLAPAGAQAQATRTWVSGVGDDVNPCSRTAPCKTFAGAISKTAAGGEIDALDPGGFGTVTITKAITIDGGGTMASILASGTNGINVNAGSTDVVILRNLSINGAGTTLGLNGVNYLAGLSVSVENCVVMNFSQTGISAAPSTAGGTLYVTNTKILNSGGTGTAGLFISSANAAGGLKAFVGNTVMENNFAGLTVSAPSGKPGIIVAVANSVASGSQKAGFTASTGGGGETVLMTLDHVHANNNGNVGVQSVNAGATVYIGNSTIVSNNKGVVASGGTVLSYKNNQINANTISDGTPLTVVPGGPLN
jgi:hypothetical protein